jgi:hypothetical protein
MSVSSFLDNLMRSGASAHNGRVVFSGTTLSVTDYGGGAFNTAQPLLVRFSSGDVSVMVAGSLSLDFGAASWGLEDDAGSWSLAIGLQRINDTTCQLCAGISNERGDVTSVTPANATSLYHIAATLPVTGKTVWIARINNVMRQSGAWVTANAWMEE